MKDYKNFIEFYRVLKFKLFNDQYSQCFQFKNGNSVKFFDISTDYTKLEILDYNRDVIAFCLKYKEVFIIPLELPDGDIFSFILRSKETKNFLNIKLIDDVPLVYGLIDFSDFKYNTPIILVEGVKDAQTIKLKYKYTLAYLRASISKSLIEYLKLITNRLIVIPDNDKAGKNLEYYLKYDDNTILNRAKIYYCQTSKDFGDYWISGNKCYLLEIENILRLENLNF